MHSDAIDKGQKVLIVDDLLATGGTARATVDLVRQLGGDVHGVAVLIELAGLNGRAKLAGENVRAVLDSTEAWAAREPPLHAKRVLSRDR